MSISPHSVDPREWAPVLQLSIDESKTIAERIEKAVDDARQEQVRIIQTVAPLQERLQLSAQMLTALQSQITRIEIALAELKAQEKKAQVAEARAQQRLADVELRIESAVERFARELEAMSKAELIKFTAAAGATPPGHPSNPVERGLDRLSTTMHEIAERLAQISQVRKPEIPVNAGNSTEAGDQEPADIHVDAPLRFQKWASGA